MDTCVEAYTKNKHQNFQMQNSVLKTLNAMSSKFPDGSVIGIVLSIPGIINILPCLSFVRKATGINYQKIFNGNPTLCQSPDDRKRQNYKAICYNK